MHGEHTTRHSRAQLVFACTAGTPHATLALSWFMHAVAFLHARRAHHSPPSRSVGSCMQLVFACTAGTPHATLRSVGSCMQLLLCMHRGHTTRHSRAQLAHACSWFLHARRAHHTPLSRSVGSCMHGGHTTRHSRAQLVFACSWFLHARRAIHTPLSRSVDSS